MKKLTMLALFSGLALGLGAHDPKEHKAVEAAVAATKGAAQAAAAAGHDVVEAAKDAKDLDVGALIKESYRSHRHNRLVHFPIALGALGVLFAFLALRNEKFKTAARWTLFLAAVSAVLAFLSGHGAADALEEWTPALKKVVHMHKTQATALMISLWIAWLVSFGDWAKKWSWVVYLFVLAAIAYTGSLGGVIAHMNL